MSNNSPPGPLSGHVALITGAGRGIGRAIAERLAGDGAAVALVARSDDELQEVREAIEAEGGQAIACPLDLVDPGTPAQAVTATVAAFGGLSILVNNAGGAHKLRTLERLAEEDFRLGTELNYSSVYRLMREAGPHLFASAGELRPSVLNIVSIGAQSALEGMSYYTGAKSAVTGLSRTAAREWGPHGVRVNCLAPGWIETDLSASLRADATFVDSTLGRTPLGRFGTPTDVADAAAFLVSDAAAFVTGTTLFVDGGYLT